MGENATIKIILSLQQGKLLVHVQKFNKENGHHSANVQIYASFFCFSNLDS